MKTILLISTLIFSISNAWAITLTGNFPLNKKNYNLTISYNLQNNEEASSKGVNYFPSTMNPEIGVELPAYCNFYMSFPVYSKVVIKNASTEEVVYSKVSSDNFLGSAGGGLYSENKCNWEMDGWNQLVPSQMRISETSFTIDHLTYRFVLDTYSLISVIGSKDLHLNIKSSTPAKGNDGKKDGEVWLDTIPAKDGSYNRTWFTLSL
jgi:hypothetical protein